MKNLNPATKLLAIFSLVVSLNVEVSAQAVLFLNDDAFQVEPSVLVSPSYCTDLNWIPGGMHLAFRQISGSIVARALDKQSAPSRITPKCMIFSPYLNKSFALDEKTFRNLAFSLSPSKVVVSQSEALSEDRPGHSAQSLRLEVLDMQTGKSQQVAKPVRSILSGPPTSEDPFVVLQLVGGETVILNSAGEMKPIGLQSQTVELSFISKVGTEFVFEQSIRNTNNALRPLTQYIRINVAQGTAVVSKQASIRPFVNREPILLIDRSRINPGVELQLLRIQRDHDESGVSNGTEVDEQVYVLPSDPSSARLSEDQQYVSYTSGGTLLIAKVSRVDPDAAKSIKDAVALAEALKVAKMLALGLQLYSADNDDVFPSSEGWKEKLMPYMVNQSMCDRFTYTFPGGKLSGEAKASEVEVGYVTGKNGRAVAYADGHVIWKSGA